MVKPLIRTLGAAPSDAQVSTSGLRSLGVDPSTKTGICLLNGPVATSSVINYPQAKGYDRLQLIADRFDELLHQLKPNIVVIEGYAFGNRFTLADLVEIGSQMRLSLHRAGIPWYIASPSLLKKYVTGSGVAKKPEMAEFVKSRWGYESPSDDVVDAYGLAKIAQTIGILGSESVKGVERG